MAQPTATVAKWKGKVCWIHSFLLCCILALPASSDTIIPAGNVSGTWTSNGSPYVVTGIISVSGTLTVQAGVVVRFQSATSLTVPKGSTFRVTGSAAAPVLFTADETTPTPGYWVGLQVVGSQEANEIAHLILEYATHGISCAGSGGDVGRVTASYATIRYCSGHGIYAEGHGSPLLAPTME